MVIVALTGMPAAGKGEVAAIAQKRGWARIRQYYSL